VRTVIGYGNSALPSVNPNEILMIGSTKERINEPTELKNV
jgi:hypothetical protein